VGDIIIEETNHRAFVITMANFLMLAAAVAVCIYGFIYRKKPLVVIGIPVAIIFFVGFIAAIIKSLNKKIFLTITTDGIIDSSSIGGYGFIPYYDIRDFEIVHYHGVETIAVNLKNPESFIDKLPQQKRRQARRNLNLKLPAIILHTELAKDMVPQDILTLLQKRLRDYNSLYI